MVTKIKKKNGEIWIPLMVWHKHYKKARFRRAKARGLRRIYGRNLID